MNTPKTILLAFGVSILAGCANAPNISDVGYIDQVMEVQSQTEAKSGDDTKQDKRKPKQNSSEAAQPASATKECRDAGVMAPSRTNLQQLAAAIPCRINHFNAQWQQIETDQWQNTWATDYGTGFAVLAVAAHATPYAIGGALVAAIAQANDKIDGPAKQSAAWQKAAHAYECIKGFADPLAASQGYLRVAIGSPDATDEKGDVYAARVLYDALLKVDYTLQDRLRIDTVTTPPDWNAILAQAKTTTQPAPVTNAKALNEQFNEALNPTLADKNAAKEKADKFSKLLGSFKTDLGTCIAAN